MTVSGRRVHRRIAADDAGEAGIAQRSIGLVSLLVRDYDEALAFYVGRLGFDLVEDMPQSEGKRWIVVGPPGGAGTRLLLAKAVGEPQLDAVGNQSGGRVFLFLETDDALRDYADLTRSGVAFREEPRTEPYGIVAVFEDLHGNLWDLIEPRT